jgi:toxin YoeB
MKIIWHDIAWKDYLYWQGQDRRTLKKINNLVRDIERSSGKPPGQSERLKGNLSGMSSSRIDEKNRLIWFVENGALKLCRAGGIIDTIDILC